MTSVPDQVWFARIVTTPVPSTPPCSKVCALAKTAPKLYVGGLLDEPREKAWESWKAGLAEMTFEISARAPSNVQLARWTTVV